MKEVSVINRNPDPRTDGFHGIQYTFKPNEKVTVPLEAAVHMFGFGVQPGTPKMQEVMRRLGFTSDVRSGMNYLNNFDMKLIEYVPTEDAEELQQVKIELEEALGKLKDAKTQLELDQAEIKGLNERIIQLQEEIGLLQEGQTEGSGKKPKR